ncbi:histone deacetylase 6-like isoform X2 [Amphiura filiformis]|uniref:histone deacetylase 6-like isoform X1 n=1 Tax=Amphiura filiformis TaxID=82378 RepID=UPI003B221E01
MTHMLCSLAQGKVVLALEGGYNLNSISQSMAYCTRTLLGDPFQSLKPGMPCTSALESILETLHQHQKYWKCLQYQVALPKREIDAQGVTTTGAGEEDPERQDISQPETPRKKPDLLESDITDTPKTGGSTESSEHLISQLVKAKSEEPADMPTNGDGDAASGNNGGGGDSLEETGAAGGSDAAGGSSGGNGLTIGHLASHASDISLPIEEAGHGLHAVIPLSWCPHLESDVMPLPDGGVDTRAPCLECADTRENWVCLHCYQVFCGRYINEHMVLHGAATMHPLVLSYSDLSVWCYGCDSYVHHEILVPAKTSAHRSKFGEDM